MNQQVPGTESVAKAACSIPRSNAFARPAGLLIGLAFAVLYLVTLDRTGFWLDEVSTLLDIRRPFLDMIRARAEAGHGPVYFSLARVWARLVGESEWLLRLPSVLAWMLVVALAAHLVAKRLGEWVAVLAVSLLPVTSPLVYLAQIARPYMLSILLVILALYGGLQGGRRAECHVPVRRGADAGAVGAAGPVTICISAHEPDLPCHRVRNRA